MNRSPSPRPRRRSGAGLRQPVRGLGGSPEGQDHPRPHLPAAEPQPAVQPEQHGVHGRDRHRHHRHRGGRLERHARAVRRHADRQEPVPHRSDLAGGLHRLVLSARAREGARARRARPRALGHQGQGAEAAGARAARRHAAGLLRVLRDRRRAGAGGQAAAEGARARDHGGRLSRVPHGCRRRADRRRLRHPRRDPADRPGLPGRARGRRARTATGASTCTSASISTTRSAPAR